MGAEYVGAVIALKVTRDEALVNLETLAATEPEALIHDYSDVTGYWTEDDDENPLETVLAGCRLAIEDVYDAWLGNSREGMGVTLGGVNYVFTGGSTWGDSPTDLYDSVNLLDILGVTE